MTLQLDDVTVKTIDGFHSDGVSVRRGPDTCVRWMWMGKCRKMRIAKKVRGRKRKMLKAKKKINKQTKERNLSIKSLSDGWTLFLPTERDANS